MSGFSKTTGVFELTSTKARFWFRDKQLQHEFRQSGKSFMSFLSFAFKRKGYQIIKTHGGYLKVKATPEQVWELLSGEPSSKDRAAHYYR